MRTPTRLAVAGCVATALSTALVAGAAGLAEAAPAQGCVLAADFQGDAVPAQTLPDGYIGGVNCTFVTGAVTDYAGLGSWTIVWGHYTSDASGALTFVQDGKVHDSGTALSSQGLGAGPQIPAGETVFAYIDWQGTNGGSLVVGNAAG